jgi:hypothetical protein
MREGEEQEEEGQKGKPRQREQVMMFISRRLPRQVLPILVLAVFVLGVSSASALAATEGPGWEIVSNSYPTNLSPQPAVSPSVSGTVAIDVFNVGARAAGCTDAIYNRELTLRLRQPECPDASVPSENPITVTDRLPAGLRAVEAGELKRMGEGGTEPVIRHALWVCTGNGGGASPGVAGATVVTCTNKVGQASEGEGELGLLPGGGGMPTFAVEEINNPTPVIGVAVEVQPGAPEHETNYATIAGGGAPTPASASDPIAVSSAVPLFEVSSWDGWFSNADGTLDTQAGSHPYEATFDLNLATIFEQSTQSARVTGGEIRTAEVELPPGFVGDPTAVPQCPREQFDAETCSLDSMIGTLTAYFANVPPVTIQVLNLVPPLGVPAEFGFSVQALNTYLDASVRSGSDYGITEHVSAVAHKEIAQTVTTLWGNPGDPSHNRWRGGKIGGCTQSELGETGNRCATGLNSIDKPFLTLPTSCGGTLPFVFRATSWTGEKSERTFYMHDSNGNGVGLSGCEDLAFGPSFTASPDTANADTPTGLTVDVKPPLGGLAQVEGLSSADIKDTTVRLSPGLVINPGQAAGLQACQPGQDGLTTDAEKEVGEEDNGPPSCPNASKVGTVKAKTPLLEGSGEKELEGNVYVMQSNPPHLKLLAAFSADGVNVKLVLNTELCQSAGEVIDGSTCQAAGQLIAKVANIPAFPVSDFKLSFSGGAQAALDTPTQCGTYTATSDFTPWSSPFTADFTPTAAFGITAGPGSGPCPSSPLGFSPVLTAGSTTDQAGGFTDFSLLLQRDDGQQRIEKLSFKAPQGLSGVLASVPLCDEADANAGTCPMASHIGHTVVASGPGPYPLVLPQPGEPELPIYLTGPYRGAPFGLSIVTPVLAGPFNLGTIVTRAKIEVDPHTAAITVTTDPLPQTVAGVPTDLRSIDAVIDRPGFMFNPTNCNPQSFSGVATSAQGVTAPISSPFGVGSCRSLEFKPKFAVSTPGKTSKANGAGLSVKLSYPAAAQGTQANITRVKVDLPKQLPSRLTTLQKACTNAQFEANPAGCPAASVIGHARVLTPLLPVPVEGPAYFVSHGGEAFPSLIMLLQGDGVTVELVGTTFISKAGITSSTFKTVPDVPFSTFTLTLPQGKYSALAANGNLCKSKLAMPTEFLAQNGAKINESTPVSATGCAKAKVLSRPQKLAVALRACRKKAKGAKRAGCEMVARKHYGPVKKRKAQTK